MIRLMASFLRTFAPILATLTALGYQTACSSDDDDEATGGKANGGSGGGSTGGSSTGGKSTGGSAGKGGNTTGGNGGTSNGGAGGAGGAPGGAGGAGGSEDCFGTFCGPGTYCAECFNPDNPDEPLHACISSDQSC
jgi:hypothetical protein